MKLWEYKGKRLKIIDIDGNVFKGSYDSYTSALDAYDSNGEPDGMPKLTIAIEDNRGTLVEFDESEIASIEIISADSIMAEAI